MNQKIAGSLSNDKKKVAPLNTITDHMIDATILI